MATQNQTLNQNQFLLLLPVGHLNSMQVNIREALRVLYKKSKGEHGLTEDEKKECKALDEEYSLLMYWPTSASREIFVAWEKEDKKNNPQKYDF